MSIDDQALLAEINRLREENARLAINAKANWRMAKPWKATIYSGNNIAMDKKGEPLVKSFDKASAAERWLDLRLFEQASDSYAVMEHHHSSLMERIERWESIARLLKMKKGPTYHTVRPNNKSLSFEWKMKSDRAEFSRG